MSQIIRYFYNFSLVPILIISGIFAFPVTLFYLPYGFRFVITLNNTFKDKVIGVLLFLICGYPLYYYLCLFAIFDWISLSIYYMFNLNKKMN